MDLTIIYYTENRLPEPLFSKCQQLLVKAASGRPIVSISHKPIQLGVNICVGDLKPCWLTLYKQVLLGAKIAETKYIAMAEHDCLYTDEHFSFVPPKDDTFYYNENVCMAQWTDRHPELKGMFSHYWTQRLALSQLICNREIFIKSTQAKYDVLTEKEIRHRYIANAGEPGLTNIRKAQKWAKSGRPVYLKKYLEDQLEREKYEVFKTKVPNLDIRHDGNFTGPKRGVKRTFELPYWGRLEDVLA